MVENGDIEDPDQEFEVDIQEHEQSVRHFKEEEKKNVATGVAVQKVKSSPATDDTSTAKKGSFCCRSKQHMCCCLIALLLLIGAIVGALYVTVLNEDDEPEVSTAPDNIDDGTTLAPTSSPTSDAWAYIMSILSPYTAQELLLDDDSPQGESFLRLVAEEEALPSRRTAQAVLQRYALLSVFYATSGSEWEENSGWQGDGSECSWYGVTCSSDEIPVNTLPSSFRSLSNTTDAEEAISSDVLDDMFMRVVESLELSTNALSGHVPREICLLSEFLELIDMGNNENVTGSIPSCISAQFFELRVLELDDCGLTGEIPPGLLSLPRLRRVEIYGNKLTGSIEEFSVSDSTKLEILKMHGNNLTNTIPTSIGKLEKLVRLNLYGNNLSGNLPSELSQLENLEECILSGNVFEGAIPSELSQLENLEKLILHQNEFTGEVSEICDLMEENGGDLAEFTTDCESDDIVCECCSECF